MSIQEEDFETTIKVIVVGNGGVGKTSMIRRFCKGAYTDAYKKTIGVDFLEKRHYIDALGEEIVLLLWDTAGQEEFDTLTRKYYRGAGACVLAFSTTDRDSFLAIEKWKKKVEDECGDISCVLVQNKTDLLDQAVVTTEESEGLARKLGLKFYRTCVKDNYNVTEVFEYLSEEFVRRKNILSQPTSSSVAPITSISSLSTPTQPVESIAAPSSSNNTIAAPASSHSHNGQQNHMTNGTGTPQNENKGFQLKPSKQRTKGKKKKVMINCSIL
eukprot:TRINITY_DN54_c0_g1::TRINITY_DN54_c0_g1_i1::g.14762::m.14762 TRINITY_DN54_c0_g1::TRINITY_DN54_c0_g1_i1::g.14762  ORF type:complete len:271 (+),score=61.56,sp/Q9ULC3/RAB23_HUMAN/48.87/1e-75,Ras/PF00071.17/1.3e-48,Miro/PF08477.8/5.4e-15,Arf/PF00025.16/7.6e-07,MMR_HSR1/PF01926.18/0.00029,MobB/PF03205.9/0.027,MobB/PF03205.9/7.5e+02,MobB/PF03205.9/1.4e+03,Gtr1_RagA/PF04670.7/0.0064,Gtr1_RagA/PF04670.7/3.2e+03,PduV-EutP/PF10662.4/0.037,AAA_24/PF13479.1/0.066,AAA_24/PF13479.1/1.5e+03,FeoB_N/PF02421.13/3